MWKKNLKKLKKKTDFSNHFSNADSFTWQNNFGKDIIQINCKNVVVKISFGSKCPAEHDNTTRRKD